MKRIILLIIGFISLGIGAFAAIVPLLPSFPFLAITALCFANSSEKFNTWYRNSSIYKNNLESYMQGRGMTKRAKIKLIITITLTFSIGIFFTRNTPWVWVVLSIWACHVLYFGFGTKTITEEEHALKHRLVRFNKVERPLTEEDIALLKEKEGIQVAVNNKKKRISVLSKEELPKERLESIFEPFGYEVVSIK